MLGKRREMDVRLGQLLGEGGNKIIPHFPNGGRIKATPARVARWNAQRLAAEPPADVKREAAKDRLAYEINRAPSPLMDRWTTDAWADIRATELALGLPPATQP